MRRFVIAAVAYALVVSGGGASNARGAAGPDGKTRTSRRAAAQCSTQAQLQDYLEREHSRERAVILARDHLRGWAGFVWDGSDIRPDRRPFSNLHLDNPRVDLRKGEQLLVFVTNTNPLIFSAGQTSATLVDRPDLANIQAVISGFAGVISGSMKTIAAQKLARSPAETTRSAIVPAGSTTPTIDEITKIKSVSGTLVSHLDAERAAVADAISKVHDSGVTAARLLQRIANNEAAMFAFVSRVESGGPVRPLLDEDGRDVPLHNRDLPAEVDAALREFSARQYELQKTTTSCTGKIALAKRAVTAWLDGASADNNAAAKEGRSFRADVSDLQQADCSSTFATDLQNLGKWLQAHPPVKRDRQDSNVVDTLETALFALDQHERVTADRAAVLTEAQKVGTNRLSILNSAGAFRTMLNRQKRHYADSDCSLTEGVIEVQRNARTEVNQPFDKSGSESFVVALDEQFSGVTVLHPRKVEASYEVVARRDFDVDVDFAPVYTTIADPTFGVVMRPDGTKVIERTKQSTRAGQIAAFATLKWWRFPGIAPQFGASLSTDAPGAFVGLAWVPSRYFKVSGGLTEQKVTRLAKALAEHQAINNESELQTRDAFEGRPYLAISVTIDNLPLFKKP